MGKIGLPALLAAVSTSQLIVIAFQFHCHQVTEATSTGSSINQSNVSTAETFELSCVSTNIHFDSPETPPNRIINCSVANGTIAEIFCIYDSVTASDVTTVTECTLPVIISLDSTVFKPGIHTITIFATLTSGDVATYSENFAVPDLTFRIDCFVTGFQVFGGFRSLTFQCGVANGIAVEYFCIYDNGTDMQLITECTLPLYIQVDPTLFEPGLHTITIVANSATGQMATFSYNFTVPDIIAFRCIQLREPGKTVVICKTSQPDATSRCGLVGSFENTSIISLLTPQYFMGILLNCDDIILQSPRIPPGTHDLHIEAQKNTFNEMYIPITISEPQLVECRTSYDCTTNGTLMSAEECCVHNTDGLAYTIAGKQECHVCIVFGWFQDSFIGIERDLRYSLQAGYQKGASYYVNTSFRFDVVSRMGSASSLDFLVENDTLIMEGPGGPQELIVAFFEDGIAQELNETFTINLEPLFSDLEKLPSGEAVFFIRSIKMTIVDSDRVVTAFSNRDYQISEFSQNVLIEITKDSRIASSITLSIIPQTIDEVILSGGSLPINIPPDDPHSPNRASTEDFVNRVINVTFEADESRSSSVLSVLVAIPVINDDVNEATEVFAVQLVLTDSVSPDMITLSSPAASLCTIVDDDPINIGFEYSSYSFRESDSQQLLFLMKESGRVSEQSFLLLIQLSDSGFTLSYPSIQLATLGRDFEIANATNQGDSALTLEFTPSQQRIDFSINILQDSIPEKMEVFRARLLLPGVGPMGTPGYIPYQNDVFSEALIYIEDDDRFLLGFDETVYEVSESAEAVEICVQVFNPPNHLHFSTIILLHALAEDGSASLEDYEQLSISSVQLNFTDDHRRRCFNVTIIDDNVSEQIENFHVQLVADSTSSSLSVDLLPNNATVYIVDDDGTIVGFESGTYVALEAEESVLVCLQVLNEINGHTHQANDSVNLVILSANMSATSEEDYTDSVVYYELTSDAGSGHCFNIGLTNDDIMEPVEDFDLSLHVISSLSPVLIDPNKRTTSIVIVDDDGSNMTCNDPINDNCICFMSSIDDAIMCGCSIGYEAVMVSGSSICQDIDECASMSSLCPGGTCVNTPGSYLCICLPGYTIDPIKESCIDIDECSLGMHDCSINARCTNTAGSYQCNCIPGFIGNGRFCSKIDIDECASRVHNCEQVCINTNGSYECGCKPGYNLKGNSRECEDVDECRIFPNGYCDRNAMCTNTNGSHLCTCNNGFIGNGRTCININECAAGLHSCGENANCIDTIGGYNCSCKPMFFESADGKTCIEGIVPKISTAEQFGLPNHNLTYNIGSEICLESPDNVLTVFCQLSNEPIPAPLFEVTVTVVAIIDDHSQPPSIFLSDRSLDISLNSTLLSEIFSSNSTINILCHVSNPLGGDNETTLIRACGSTECQDGVTNNCTQTCTRSWLNETYSYECGCRDGYSTNQTYKELCDNVNECASSATHNCSESNNEVCQDTDGSYVCVCKAGFHGEHCMDIDECQLSMNLCSQNCINTEGSYECYCGNGYTLDVMDNSTCLDINECENDGNNCSHQCKNTEGSYQCSCPSGYILNDSTCLDIDECTSDSFKNCSQNCTNTEGSYQCSCYNGYSMDPLDIRMCQDVDECSLGLHSCDHNADCTNTLGSFSCSCKAGYEGNGQSCQVVDEVLIGSIVGSGLVIGIVVIIVAVCVCYLLYHSHVTKSTHYSNEPSKDHLDFADDEPIPQAISVQSSYKLNLPPHLIIPSSCIKLVESIGQGEFGIVYKSHLNRECGTEIVAIKTLKGFYQRSTVREMLKESSKMYGFQHPHVVTLIGVCLDGGPAPYIIMPFMANGSLLAYLRRNRDSLLVSSEEDNSEEVAVTTKRLLDMCIQVAKGMEYLAHMKVVHRDLAARNCMININFVIKVADFGLAESIGSKEYFRQDKDTAVKLPLKWMAPESIEDHIFSEKSDVWAYGVTCWEIFSVGKVPYPGVALTDLHKHLASGQRMEKPTNKACCEEMYMLMLQCWEPEAALRPSFSDLVESISALLENFVGYMDVNAFEIKLTNANFDDHEMEAVSIV